MSHPSGNGNSGRTLIAVVLSAIICANCGVEPESMCGTAEGTVTSPVMPGIVRSSSSMMPAVGVHLRKRCEPLFYTDVRIMTES